MTSEGKSPSSNPALTALYEAELRFKSRGRRTCREALCVNYAHSSGLKLVDELHYDEVFEFESLDDYLAAMRPKDMNGLEIPRRVPLSPQCRPPA